MVSGRQAKRKRADEVLAERIRVQQTAALDAAMAVLDQRRGGFGGVFEDLRRAVRADNEVLIPLLVSRSERRAAMSAESESLLPPFAWRTGFVINLADQILDRLEAPWHWRTPVRTRDERWRADLRQGLDVYARICWCARFGYTFAALALARKHFERWTHNIAWSAKEEQFPDETEREFINRMWSDHGGVTVDRDRGADWAALSELLHGRSARIAGADLRVELEMSMADRLRVHSFVVRFAEQTLRRVRGVLWSYARDVGALKGTEEDLLLVSPKGVKPLPDPPDFLDVFHEPHLYEFVTSSDARVYGEWGATYRRIVAKASSSELRPIVFASWMSIEERWARAIDEARAAFESERSMVGSRFDPTVSRETVGVFRVISEMADLVAIGLPESPRSQALRTAAAALEAAWILWLQDVDDSLTCMRSVLESTARARTHRLKPEKAARLESRGQASTPHRWLDAAGWGRLAAFARALGEFSHLQPRSRHRGSRQLLEDIQVGPTPDEAEYTARGHALSRVAMMLAAETSTSLHELDPDLDAAFRGQILATEVDDEEVLAGWLDRAMAFRSHDFGEPDYTPDATH